MVKYCYSVHGLVDAWTGGWSRLIAVNMDWWVVVVKYCYSMHGLVGGLGLLQ